MANDKRKNIKNEKEGSKVQNFSKKTGNFFTGIRNELKKVVWPSKLTLKETTLAVLAISIGVAILVFVVDSLMMGLLNLAGFNKPHVPRTTRPAAQTETVSSESEGTETSSLSTESSDSVASESETVSESNEGTAATGETENTAS